jgi:integrase
VPTRPAGVYQDSGGGWYFKVTVGRDSLTGRREQITRRGFRTASEAARARREVLGRKDSGLVRPSPKLLTVNQLLDLYLDGLDADCSLGAKTRFDYRINANAYVRPWLGARRVRDVTPEVILNWQRELAICGSRKGNPLAPNTIRLARAPLAGAFKLAVATGMVAVSPLSLVTRPKSRRSIPKHWSPEQARDFLALMEGDRTYGVWAFLLGSGLRIGELVWLRWINVDVPGGLARVVEFATALGHQVVASEGKSRDAVRTIDLDPWLVGVLRAHRKLQSTERLAAADYEDSDYVFTKPHGGPYHPQYLSRMLGRYTEELGLPRLTAHGLRHTCATLMLANGVPAKVAAERLGHADPTLFMNLYSHVTPTMQKDAAARIGMALSAPAG